MTTSYANAGGTGDRRAIITVTTDISLGAGAITALIDGAQADTMWFHPAQTLRHIVFAFGASKVIDEFKWYQDTSGNQGLWSLQGSNDNSTWTDIATGLNLAAVNPTNTFSFTNTTGYSYYQLAQTSGGTDSTPFVREIEFKIGDPPAPPVVTTVQGAKSVRILASVAGDHTFRTVTLSATGPAGVKLANQVTDNSGHEIETVYAGPTGASGFKSLVVAGYTGPA